MKTECIGPRCGPRFRLSLGSSSVELCSEHIPLPFAVAASSGSPAALLGSSAVPTPRLRASRSAGRAGGSCGSGRAPARRLRQRLPAPAPTPFSFDILSQQMKHKAKADFVPADIKLPDFIAQLGYDDYQHIQYRPDHARWTDPGQPVPHPRLPYGLAVQGAGAAVRGRRRQGDADGFHHRRLQLLQPGDRPAGGHRRRCPASPASG